MAEPNDLTLVIMREIREDLRAVGDRLERIESRIDGGERRLEHVDARLDRMEQRIDAMHVNGAKALKSFIGHRTTTERAFGSMDTQLGEPETRVTENEARQ